MRQQPITAAPEAAAPLPWPSHDFRAANKAALEGYELLLGHIRAGRYDDAIELVEMSVALVKQMLAELEQTLL